MRLSIVFALACICGSAAAQSRIIVDVEDAMLLPGESTTVTLSAAWPPSEYAFASIRTGIGMAIEAGSWSDLELIPVMDGPGTTAGTPAGGGVTGIFAWQFNFGPTGSEPDLSNPIPFWRGTYTAPDMVPTPMELEFTTMTTQFEVYFMPRSLETTSYLDELTEGTGVIRVVPAPGPVAMLLAGGCWAGRRRRGIPGGTWRSR
jgi:hypothetical protein